MLTHSETLSRAALAALVAAGRFAEAGLHDEAARLRKRGDELFAASDRERIAQ